MSDISRIRRYVGFGLVFLFQMGMQIALVLFQLVRLDPGLTLVAVAFSSPVIFVSYRFSRLYHQISRQSQDEQGDLTTIVEESATGVRVIKAFGRMPERSALYRKHAEKLYRTNLRGVDARKRLWTLDILLLGLSVVGILLWGGIRVIDGGLTIGALAEFVLYQQMLVWPIRETGWIIAMGQEASAGADRVYELLDTRPDIADAPGAITLQTCQGEIRFEDVWFKYPGSDAWILRGIDFADLSGRDARARRHNRLRQDDYRCAAVAVLRPHLGPGDTRRQGSSGDHGRVSALARHGRVRGSDPVLGLDPRERPHGQTRRRRRRSVEGPG